MTAETARWLSKEGNEVLPMDPSATARGCKIASGDLSHWVGTAVHKVLDASPNKNEAETGPSWSVWPTTSWC